MMPLFHKTLGTALLWLMVALVPPSILKSQTTDSLAIHQKVANIDSLSMQAVELARAGQYASAIALFDSSLAMCQKQLPDDKVKFYSINIMKGRCYYGWGKYVEAEQIMLEANAFLEPKKAENMSLYGNLQEFLGFLYDKTGRYVNAESYYKKCIDARLEKYGAENAEYAKALNNLSNLYITIGNYKEAEQLCLEMVSIRKRLFGELHNDYAGSLSNLALIYRKKYEFPKAELVLLELISIRENTLGKEHRFYASALHSLASLYSEEGSYEKAELLFQEVLLLQEKILGKMHQDYARTLFNLGNLFKEKNEYEKAEALYIEALIIREKVIGKNHSEYASSLKNLANLYRETGELSKSESYYRQAKEILAGNTPQYAAFLIDFGNFYAFHGNDAIAKQLYLQAFDIIKNTTGLESSEYATIANNLAALYSNQGDYDQSLKLNQEALRIRKNVFGEKSIFYANSLNNISYIYNVLNRPNEAEPLLLESKAILEKVVGKYHSEYARVLGNISNVSFAKGDIANTERLLIESQAIHLTLFGNNNQTYLNSLADLVEFYQSTNRDNLAKPLILELNKTAQKLIINSINYLTENQASAYINNYQGSNNRFYSFAGKSLDSKMIQESFNNALFQKGFLMEAVSQRNKLTQSDTAAISLDEQQKSYLRRLSKEYAKPAADRDSVRMADWTEKADALEKELTRKVAGYGDLVRQVNWQAVRDRLLPQEAAIEFIHYNQYSPRRTDSILYAALLLLPNDSIPHFIPLFEERQLLPLLNRPGFSDETIVKDLYGNHPDLAQLFWSPLKPWLKEVQTIYYAPSGLLHRINPIAMLDENGESITTNKQWVRISSTRTLVAGRLADQSFAHKGAENAPFAVIFGGIQYEMDSTAFAMTNRVAIGNGDGPNSSGNNFYFLAGNNTTTRSSAEGAWTSLPATAREADAVNDLLQKSGYRTDLQKGLGASEEHLKKIGTNTNTSPRIIHLATHGFAYPDPKKSLANGLENGEPTNKLQDDPMLRSGLLLAGSNFYWKNKRPLVGLEDGVLVAYEVRDLNLRHTELAVLSACQTGLGDVVGSEGVYGMQRAFRIAGVKFLIVSLWQVPDAKTQELMNIFYKNYLIQKEPLRTAFNHAQQSMRLKDPNPFDWAGFVLIE